MAGRGVTSDIFTEEPPDVVYGTGFEFRAISDPTKLYHIKEPFGVNENKIGGINDSQPAKTGSMVSSFINAYYKTTGKVVVGISASQGGTRINQWLPDGTLLPDAINRLTDAVAFLESHNYVIDRKYMLWCQGESDGDDGTPINTYKSKFKTMFNAMKSAGIQKCFIVRIGKYNGSSGFDYTTIINAQTELCKN
jgi:hypothetical protein